MKLFCSYYCAALATVAIPFFTLLFFLEYSESEYMRIHFRRSRDDTDSRTLTIGLVIAMFVAILVGLVSYIRKLHSQEEEDMDGKVETRWQFMDKIQKPSAMRE